MNYTDGKLKHLEFIQNVITRMNANSFMIKGWTVTIVAALLALSVSKSTDVPSYYFICISTVVITVFWVLDAFYLSQEKQYRALYNKVITEVDTDFSMNASIFNKGNDTWLSAFFTATLLVFYGLLGALTYVLTAIVFTGS